ncbi:B12-binding domain-containing radical SAM protein [bacterium]|nr:B12-binding domain-containing radical SAM protein [candidate division CSSED10-310 bacterium]
MKFFESVPEIHDRFKNRRTVLLINPHHHHNWNYHGSVFSFPIGLLYLAVNLKQAGYRPVIIDACAEPEHLSQIDAETGAALFAGISAMTPQVSHGRAIASHIRNTDPDIPIVWGGIHPSLYPESCLDPVCDIAVLGEGDRTCVDIADAVQKGYELNNIPGIAFQTGSSTIHKTEPRDPLPMNELPEIDYSLIDPEHYIESYVIQEQRKARTIPIHAARGCPWHCTFCINTTLNAQRRYRPRPADSLLDEIESLAATYRLEGIILQDEEFFADRQRLLQFLDGIEKRKLHRLKYYATCRINHFRPDYINRTLLRRMKRCGFVDLVFGFESGSTHCLEIIQKEITVDQGLYAARLLAEEGYKAVWGFIMAIPGETTPDRIKTLRLMEKLRSISEQNYFIGPQIFRPYPGSQLYREALLRGLTEPTSLKEWSELDFTPEGWFGTGELPWIQDGERALIDYINFLAPVYYNRRYLRSTLPVAGFHAALRILFRARLALDFWKWPVEHRVRNLVKYRLSRGQTSNYRSET